MKNIGGTYINYTYAPERQDSWLSCFPTNFNTKADDSDSRFQGHPFQVAGQVQFVETGLSYRITDQILTTDREYVTEPCDDFHLIIYFYNFNTDTKLRFEIGKTVIENESPDYRAIIMTNSRVPQKLSLKKGTTVKGLALMISENWITNNLRSIDSHKYEQLTNNELILDYLTAKDQKILEDLLEGIKAAHLPGLYATSRAMRLLCGFLENLFTREVSEIKETITPKDFQSVLKIETLLLQSFDEGFPKIENLARLAFMSESKLKKLYKRAFGMGLYEYYQKNRMHKAKELLHTGKYTVSQVGSMLGYQNLSNFSASFKKEFSHSPSDFMQVG